MKTIKERIAEIQARIPVLAKEYANDKETFIVLGKELNKKLKTLYTRRMNCYWREEIVKRKLETIYDIPTLPNLLKPFHYDILYKIGVLRKEQLEDGKYYLGDCRNANVAKWDAKNDCFWYVREKWGATFPEQINHLADDNGLDVFVPIKEVIPEEHQKV